MDNSGSVRLISLYRKRAKRYDRSTLLFYFAGFRHWAYRKRAIQSLALNHGDTVVDLGCGTGTQFLSLAGASRSARKDHRSGPYRCHAR